MFKPKGRENLPKELFKFGKNLIYSEGTKTEPFYVENIKKLIPLNYLCEINDIITVNKNGNSKNTDGLVNSAIKDVKNRIKCGEKITHVWIFFDKDSFPNNKFINANNKINNMNNSKKKNIYGFRYEEETGITWHSCYSNESFELWLTSYLKIDYAQHYRKDYISYLNEIFKKNKLGSYSKNMENIHDKLVLCGGSLENAINYSKKYNDLNGHKNPSTGVVEFAEFFKPYLKK